MSKKAKPETVKLIGEFCERMRGLRAQRSAWHFFDFVCNGDEHSRSKLSVSFEKWYKSHPNTTNVPKWAMAVEWFVRRKVRL